MTDKMSKPELKNKSAQRELDQTEKQFEKFDQDIKEMTFDRMNIAPKEDVEQQTKMSQREAQKANDVCLKAMRTIDSREKFNEKFRKDYEYKKEYVKFIAENREIGGESIELWTKPFPGLPAEFWQIPVNKSVWGPRYLAERIKNCTYHRLTMQDKPYSQDVAGTYIGSMVVDETRQRLDAIPVSDRKSVFMGASGF